MKPLESALLLSLGLIIAFQFASQTSLGAFAQTSNVTNLCSPNDTDTSISWCYYQNKGRVPFVFNYTYNYTFQSTYSCESSSSPDWNECSYISSVALTEITDAAVNVTYHVAIIATSQDIVVFELNSEQILTSAYLPNDTITFVESYKYNDTLTYVAIGSERINGFYILPQSFPDLTRNPFPVSFPIEMDVIQAQFFFGNSSDLVVAALLYNRQTSLYSLTFTKIIDVGNYDSNFMTWILSDAQADIDFQVFIHKGNFSVNADNVTVYDQRTLVMIYDSTYVSIYLYNETQGPIYIPFGGSLSSTFYNSNETILVAGIWTESSPRSYYNPKTGLPVNDVSQSVWLVLGVDDGHNHTLELIALPEFAQYNFTYSGNLTNPVQRGQCSDSNQYYNVFWGKCEDRPMYTTELTDQPSILRTRYVPQITGNEVQTNNGDNVNKTVSAYRAMFVANDRRITVYGAAPTEMTEFELDFEWFNEFSFFGTVEKIALSQNAQHLFASTTRFSWELESMERYYNICVTLNNGTSDQKKFLSAYQANCDENEGRLPNLNDFYQHVTMCPLGLYCPSFFEQDFQELEAGWYTINSFQKHPCEPGYFCYKGNRQQCPKGFVCPDYAMTAPIACEIDPDYETTCYDEQLIAPAVCPDGFSCPTPYMPPVPAPPGRFTYANSSRNYFGDCDLGDWCALGRYLTDNNNETTLECPANTYCTNSSILTPTVCYCDSSANNCSYCPIGSITEQPCPRGYYCEGPSSIEACKLTQYCPPGTITPQVCPAGYYCPDPSTQELCPKGYYCKVGTVVPEKCPWLSICPQGTKTETHNFLGGLLLGIAVLAIAVPWKLWERYRDKKRAERDVIRKALKKQKKEEEILLIDKSESRSSAALSELKPVDFTIDFDFKDLGLQLPGGKKVLAGVTGNIRHGRVTAVMGPSGAGKTTFLSTLSGKVSTGTILGTVTINGQKDDIANYKKVMGFVPQEDIMLTMLTVKEILLMSAELRLPSDMTNEEKHVLVNSVIDVLGLTDVRYSIIGDATKRGISGGQRKRVNIGMELVASPTVLFLDEPTSGLDSSSSQEVCDALRKIATLGITVVTVIHQPRYEIFTMFDDVLLLGKGGRTVYLGPTNKALAYFTELGFECPQHSNPADFFMDVISGSVPKKDDRNFEPADLFKLWEERKGDKRWSRAIENDMDIARDSVSYDKKYKERHTAGFLKQLFLFFIRGITQQTRDLPGLALDAGLVCLAGVFLGLVFNNAHYVGPPEQSVCNGIQVEALRARCELPLNDPVGTIGSLSTLCLSLTAVAASLRIFGAERVVFWRESASGINTLAYFLGKDLSYIPNMLVAPLLFEALFYSITAPRSTFIDLYFILLCVEIVSVSLGFLVSIVVKPSVSQLTGVVIVMIMVMFSGMRPTLKEFNNMSFPMPYVPWLSFPRWAQEALYINDTGLDALGYKLDNFALDIWMILIIAVVFRVSAFVALQFMNRDKRK